VLALVIVDTVLVLLLAGLVAGLLRSHADILRALHSLGVGVGDPSSDTEDGRAAPEREGVSPSVAAANGGANLMPTRSPLRFGPPLPAERDATSAHDIEGVAPDGAAIAVSIALARHFTLLAFLSSGCTTCAGFWRAMGSAGQTIPDGVRPVIVTKGPALESPREVQRRAPANVTVVMSSEAWDDYQVPGSPFFVLVDGHEHRRIGEGVAGHFEQVADLVRRALEDSRPPPGVPRPPGGDENRLDGRQRERRNDEALRAAGIHPGHASLYPRSLDEIFGGPMPTAVQGDSLDVDR
jgi:hypothetical protein